MLNKMPTPAMGGGGSSTASGTSFDNTNAQLPNNPDNVQNAIEEVNNKTNVCYKPLNTSIKELSNTELSWVATEDCVVMTNIACSTATGWGDIQVNGNKLLDWQVNANRSITPIPLKKGDTVSINVGSGTLFGNWAYVWNYS